MSNAESIYHGDEIAIIGMSGRFPGAGTIDAFWRNLCDGVESIAFFSDQELLAAGVDPALLDNPNYVKAGGALEDIALFDAAFFGFTPREAEVLDPQQRLFLECAWQALEHAGYDPETYAGRIGVYASVSLNNYVFNLFAHRELVSAVGIFQIGLGNDKDHLPTHVSYKLNLKGPSVNVQTACSSSLVAVHMACQSVLNGECEMALAGGVSASAAQKHGYLHREGGISSPDGHCRAFDAQARGTVSGSGLGIVVLKRLEDALADGDCIHAIVKGSAINNDGGSKVGYTAPSMLGQAEAIAEALAIARVEPQTIGYVETHGTATPLGDPIEIAALTRAFGGAERPGTCAIGSVKTNIGHLDAAAGVTGLIKTVLALEHAMLPPSLHFEQPNPQIDFANSPFYVNTTLSRWAAGETPRRAGVSSFGIGGTNAHVVLEEAPPAEATGPSRPWQLLVLSAKTPAALDAATANLIAHLRQHPDLSLADLAYTLQVGRTAFDHRRMLVCRDRDDAIRALETLEPERTLTRRHETRHRPVAFLFPGQGAQFARMGADLYQQEPAFREVVDHCCELLLSHLGLDLREVLYPDLKIEDRRWRIEDTGSSILYPLSSILDLDQTQYTQPALFVVEYALAQLWMSWGVQPQAMIGHSIGEYVAACLAGVLTLEDALRLVAARGRMMQDLPGGAMLAVPLAEHDLRPLLGDGLDLAAVNGPAQCVVAGREEPIEALLEQLGARGLECRRLRTSHAFHSALMDLIVAPFAGLVAKIALRPPKIPYISNLTGTWISADEATDPRYWAEHLRRPVRFAEGLRELLQEPDWVLLEVGPGRTLCTFARQQTAPEQVVLASIRQAQDRYDGAGRLLDVLGQLWLAGVWPDWPALYAGERRQRCPLPTYPFERQRYWVAPGAQPDEAAVRHATARKKADIADWFYIPSWKRSLSPITADSRDSDAQTFPVLLFADASGVGEKLARRLEHNGRHVIRIVVGQAFDRLGERMYSLNPRQCADYSALLEDLRALDQVPQTIIHLWGVTAGAGPEPPEQAYDRGFYSLLFLAQALGEHYLHAPVDIVVVASQAQHVADGETICPEKATVLGPCNVIPQEHPHIRCRSVDILLPGAGTWQEQRLIDQLLAEIAASVDDTVAYRGQQRWVQTFEAAPLLASESAARLREGGVYLITGGLGGIGLALAEYLARTVRAKLVLSGRSAFPGREAWQGWLATHDEHDPVSRKIRSLLAIEQLGAEVVVIGADVADQEQMQTLIDAVDARFGALHGVVHAAGFMDARAVQELDPAECERHFRPKAHGLHVLAQVLRGRSLDFCVLFSSLSSVLGGLGLAAYSAANLFMDAFAYQQSQAAPVPWISVNWDGWQVRETHERGMPRGAAQGELAISAQEGVEAFRRMLALDGAAQIVVSTADLQARIEQWVKLAPARASAPEQQDGGLALHPRPHLRSSYVAPGNAVEQTIVEVWQELLGIEGVGVHDDFFELGGHSLLATQVLSRMRDRFQVEIPLRSVFERPTAASLALVVAELQDAQASRKIAPADAKKMLAQLDQLSDAEVDALLGDLL